MPQTEKETILLVDDDPINLQVLLEYLDEEGFRVLIAEDGEDAIEQAEFAQPNIILLDVMMPGMNGFETCEYLRKHSPTREIPVILITALSDTRNKIKGFHSGAVDYIVKPFQQEEVLARIQTHLTLQRQKTELRAALEKVKLLSGLLPICSNCKMIRDDKGYWQQIESYIRKHSEAEFSHALCPECAQRLYPDLYARVKEKLAPHLVMKEEDEHDN